MRFAAIVPLLLSTAALILGFLIIFAGHKRDFLENYDILTLNISRIGRDVTTNIFDKRQLHDIIDGISNATDSLTDSIHNATDKVESIIDSKTDNITASLESEINDLANDAAASIAAQLGFRDFYSVHVMNYCQGYYTPGPVKNATVKSISRNVTACKDPSGMFAFDPTAALIANLNETADGRISQDRAEQVLEAIHWPEKLQDGIRALRAAFKATFVLYCIAVALTFLTWIFSIFWLVRDGHLGPLLIISFGGAAFLFMGVASAIATAISVKGVKEINKYGNDIGVQGQRGNGFLGLTWAATGCLFVATIVGCLGCFGVRKHRKASPYNGEKPH